MVELFMARAQFYARHLVWVVLFSVVYMCVHAAVLAVVLVHDVILDVSLALVWVECIRIVNVISTKDYEPVYGACSVLSRMLSGHSIRVYHVALPLQRC